MIAMSDEEEIFDDEQNEAGQPALPQNQVSKLGKKTGPRRSRKNDADSDIRITKQFTACGRCSYFWAGYKLLDQTFVAETAVNPDKPDWLMLTYSYAIRELVYKSFGNRLDLEFYYYEGCCSECQRPFIFHGGNGDAPSFQIRL